MDLNQYKDKFMNLIYDSKAYFKNVVSADMIEKDYYVTQLLQELNNQNPNILFKGGTSLSKGHHAIERFSEDIDLTLVAEFSGETKKRVVKYNIIDACNKIGLDPMGSDKVKSGMDYNCYHVKYPSVVLTNEKDAQVKVEVSFITREFPYQLLPIRLIVAEYLEATKQFDLIEKFSLQPFNMHVISLIRTFIDKVFALCDYYLSNRSKRMSRHIYDLYKLSNLVVIDDDFKKLVKEVRKERQRSKCLKRSPAAAEENNINEILKSIVDSKFYKKDYEEITKVYLYEDVSYKMRFKR